MASEGAQILINASEIWLLRNSLLGSKSAVRNAVCMPTENDSDSRFTGHGYGHVLASPSGYAFFRAFMYARRHEEVLEVLEAALQYRRMQSAPMRKLA